MGVAEELYRDCVKIALYALFRDFTPAEENQLEMTKEEEMEMRLYRG